jgi:hypothetical protein
VGLGNVPRLAVLKRSFAKQEWRFASAVVLADDDRNSARGTLMQILHWRAVTSGGTIGRLLMTTCPGFEVAPQAVAIAPDAG